jgi:hypothetical protein
MLLRTVMSFLNGLPPADGHSIPERDGHVAGVGDWAIGDPPVRVRPDTLPSIAGEGTGPVASGVTASSWQTDRAWFSAPAAFANRRRIAVPAR